MEAGNGCMLKIAPVACLKNVHPRYPLAMGVLHMIAHFSDFSRL